MSKIIVQQKQCKLIENDWSLLQKFDQEMSYDIQGAEYTPSYKAGIWDGKKKLLNRDLSFARGLFDKTVAFYKDRGIEPEIEYDFSKSYSSPLSIVKNLEAINKSPYYYQIDAANATLNSDCGILRMATGSGKSLVLALISALLNKQTIVYVIGCDLLYQLHSLFKSIFDVPIGIIGDGNCEIGEINIASIWTVGQALEYKKKDFGVESDDEKYVDPQKYKDIRALLKTAKVHLFDECHVAACNTIQGIYSAINPEHIYGMSASPWRDDGQDLLIESLLGKYIVDISASKLIEEGFLVQPYIRFQKVPKLKGKFPYQTIYKNYIVENEERNKLVFDRTKQLVDLNYTTLVLYNSINHGHILNELIKKQIPCVLLSGKDSADVRKQARDDLESDKTKVLIASRILDIGVDIPCLSGLVIASSGKSSVRALQRIGRVIRKHPGKKHSAIVDFHDQAKYVEDHSKARFKIYQIEPKFDVKWS